jgi:hypothetical protein
VGRQKIPKQNQPCITAFPKTFCYRRLKACSKFRSFSIINVLSGKILELRAFAGDVDHGKYPFTINISDSPAPGRVWGIRENLGTCSLKTVAPKLAASVGSVVNETIERGPNTEISWPKAP